MRAALLRCPVCGRALAPDADERAWRCGEGHAFDVARQGYVNLGGGAAGDTAAMVGARESFLARGPFDRVAAAVARAAAGPPPGAVVELGAGTGWYLARVLDALGDDGRAGVALDSSVPAARRAARAHPRIASAVADVWGTLPLLDASVALVLGVFAPRNGPETARVLAPGGRAVVVVPTPRHLGELRGPLGLLDVEPAKRDRLARSMEPLRERGREEKLEYGVALDAPAISELVRMGPTAHHVDGEEIDRRIAALDLPARCTVSVTVHRFEPG